MPLRAFTAWLAAQGFTLGMVGLALLAGLAPSLAERLNTGGVARATAITLVFFLTGLTLPTRQVLAGLLRWRVHLFIQGFSYGVLPLITWLALGPLREHIEPGLLAGFYLLAVLPTTITSCVLFTQLASGAVEVALFNAVAGNLAGVVLAPMLFVLLLGGGGVAAGLELGPIFVRIALLVLLPFAAGQALYALTRGGAMRLKKTSRRINTLSVLLIVYLAFGSAFASGLFGRLGMASWGALLMLLPAHGLVLALAWLGSAVLRLPRADRVAVIFCAPQKTLALGLPLAAACLAQRPEWIGAASLPIMVYHPLQLFVAGLLKDRLRVENAPIRSDSP